ncbi:MAG: toll/interleukin-1 receptor domain-containing protein, partial [Synergistaceae bacterium]|nr:toll/interleukin-1 receptor domain-containing protein [Synergistaceae bacterium]
MSEQDTVCNIVPCGLDDKSFVFVSYAHLDSKVIFPIIEGIGAEGYAIWYDKGISISSTWTDEIATAILNCSIFVIFITKESAESIYVRSEIEFALNNRVRIVPVYLDGMDVLPPGLALGLNATQGVTDVGSPESIVRQICAALESNDVAKKGAARDANIKYKRHKRRWRIEPRKFMGAAAAVVALAVIAFGASSFVSRSEARKGNYGFSIEKAVYAPAEPIFVELSAVTDTMIDRGAIVGVARAGGGQGDYISFEFIDDGSDRVKLRAPTEAGGYEVRG